MAAAEQTEAREQTLAAAEAATAITVQSPQMQEAESPSQSEQAEPAGQTPQQAGMAERPLLDLTHLLSAAVAEPQSLTAVTMTE